MVELFTDPRPELIKDSNHWKKLLRLIPTLEDKKIAEVLQKRLWSLRNGGAILKLYRDGLKFEIVINERSAWDTQEEFTTMKKQYLTPYAAEIKYILGKVMEP